jgi:hypothetical protein
VTAWNCLQRLEHQFLLAMLMVQFVYCADGAYVGFLEDRELACRAGEEHLWHALVG